ncbi:hypothetical protein HC023_17570, partial [Streptomyces sp. NEAU-H3]|nr:hypothetical protein [Streptomyces sp. NEAU-H3]
ALRAEDAAAERAARERVGIAKRALGERGEPPWWEQDTAARERRWEEGLRALDESG